MENGALDATLRRIFLIAEDHYKLSKLSISRRLNCVIDQSPAEVIAHANADLIILFVNNV